MSLPPTIRDLRRTVPVCDRVHLQLLYEALEVLARRLLHHDVHHLFPDGSDLRALGVARLLRLPLLLSGEGDAEETQHVACETKQKREER